VKYGGRKEYDAVRAIYEKPKTPTSKKAAMYAIAADIGQFTDEMCRRAMCASQDADLLQETLDYLLTKVRDQDVIYFVAGMQANLRGRRPLALFFKEKYDVVRVRK
jgi:aminopeptidase 2